MLVVENLEARYGGNIALKGISLDVGQREIVCLIGANGAGKSTLINCLSAVHPQRNGRIEFDGKDVSKADSQQLVRFGIVQVPENRQLFGPMTVEENLEMGAYTRASHMSAAALRSEIENVLERFPALKPRRKQRAATLSGGEQQMVAMGRGIMANPRLLLLDEPSLGLAPLIVREIFRIVAELQAEGRTILLVEQNALGALNISTRAYIIENGRLTASGPAQLLLRDEKVRRAFLGQDIPPPKGDHP